MANLKVLHGMLACEDRDLGPVRVITADFREMIIQAETTFLLKKMRGSAPGSALIFEDRANKVRYTFATWTASPLDSPPGIGEAYVVASECRTEAL